MFKKMEIKYFSPLFSISRDHAPVERGSVVVLDVVVSVVDHVVDELVPLSQHSLLSGSVICHLTLGYRGLGVSPRWSTDVVCRLLSLQCSCRLLPLQCSTAPVQDRGWSGGAGGQVIHGPVLLSLVEVLHGLNVGTGRNTLASLSVISSAAVRVLPQIIGGGAASVGGQHSSPRLLALTPVLSEAWQPVISLLHLLLLVVHLVHQDSLGGSASSNTISLVSLVPGESQCSRLGWWRFSVNDLVVDSLYLLDWTPAGGRCSGAGSSLHHATTVFSPHWNVNLSTGTRLGSWRSCWRGAGRPARWWWHGLVAGTHPGLGVLSLRAEFSVRTGAVARISSVVSLHLMNPPPLPVKLSTCSSCHSISCSTSSLSVPHQTSGAEVWLVVPVLVVGVLISSVITPRSIPHHLSRNWSLVPWNFVVFCVLMWEAIVLDCVCGGVDGGSVGLATGAAALSLWRHSYGRWNVNTSFHLLTSSKVLFIIIHKSFQRSAAMLWCAAARSVRGVVKNVFFARSSCWMMSVCGDWSESRVDGLTGRVGSVLVLQVTPVSVLVRGDGGVQHLRGRVEYLGVSVVTTTGRLSHASGGWAGAQVVETRVLVSVGVGFMMIHVTPLIIYFTLARFKLQFIMRQVTSSHTWRRGTWSLPWRLGWSDVVLLHGDRVLWMCGGLIPVEIVQFVTIHCVIKIRQSLETIEPVVFMTQAWTVFLLRVPLHSHGTTLALRTSHTANCK